MWGFIYLFIKKSLTGNIFNWFLVENSSNRCRVVKSESPESAFLAGAGFENFNTIGVGVIFFFYVFCYQPEFYIS